MPDLLAEITRVAKAYYVQANRLQITATDLYDWLATLPSARQEAVLHAGFSSSQTELDFLRFCLELRGYSMRSFLAEKISVAAYTLWVSYGEFNGDLPPHSVAR